ncbi:MAG: hypothetical protein FWF34_00465 [Alphaproteobacteria bacterium]|nr:hypothetical protein [Alphaproteobacteria bacterium]MCL2889720.1 hypothetical protein [Alphaproteobacteria bacterium]
MENNPTDTHPMPPSDKEVLILPAGVSLELPSNDPRILRTPIPVAAGKHWREHTSQINAKKRVERAKHYRVAGGEEVKETRTEAFARLCKEGEKKVKRYEDNVAKLPPEAKEKNLRKAKADLEKLNQAMKQIEGGADINNILLNFKASKELNMLVKNIGTSNAYN